MKVIKYIAIIFYIFIEVIFAFLTIYIIILILGILFPTNAEYEFDENEIQFYVTSNGVHTDICLPVEVSMHDWTIFLPFDQFKGLKQKPKYISIGWGDKGFYLDTPTWAELKFSTAFNAAFLPSPTAMHITYWDQKPYGLTSIKKCSMSNEEYLDLISFILSSFKSVNGFNPQLIVNKGYTPFDNFYEANHSYHCFRTCNTWTNQALRIAGVKTSNLALFQDGIMRWL